MGSIKMKYENRRYNKNETGKEFYARRKKAMDDWCDSKEQKAWSKKIWAEYRKAQET